MHALWIFSLAAALAFGGSSAFAQVYSWKDSSGKVHFGDRPPVAADPKTVKKVTVSSPNLTESFKDAPPAASDAPGKRKPEGEMAAPATPQPLPKRGLAAQSQDSCAAKVAAFQASYACFEACGKPIRGARNNAGCGHCTDEPMPNC